ncbi:MAG TPA: phosphotransferase [Burkholderiales bacterium]
MFVRYPGDVGVRTLSRCLARTYGLFLLDPPQPLSRSPHAAVWCVHTPTRTLVAKLFPAGIDHVVALEADLLDYLRANGLAVPRVFPTRTGGPVGVVAGRVGLQLRRERYPVLLTSFVEGRRVYPGSVTREELAAVARAIGRMHATLQAYPRRGRVRRIQRQAPRREAFAELLRSPNAACFGQRELAHWQSVDRLLQEAAAQAPSGGLTESVLHGDLGLEHVRFPVSGADTETVQLFDFSDYAWGPVVFDLAAMLSRLYWERDIGPVRWEHLRAWLLEGYASAFTLTHADERALESALLERLMIEIRYLTNVSLRTRAPFRPDGIRRRYALVEHVLRRRARRSGVAWTAAVRRDGSPEPLPD